MHRRRWTVVWIDEAERRLAELWLAEHPLKRRLLSRSADESEQSLATDPEQTARRLPEPANRFMRVHGNLAVIFEITTEDRLVRVLDVYKSKGE